MTADEAEKKQIKADLDKESPVAHPGSVEAEMKDKLKIELVHRAGIDVKVRQGDKKEAISLLGSVDFVDRRQMEKLQILKQFNFHPPTCS